MAEKLFQFIRKTEKCKIDIVKKRTFFLTESRDPEEDQCAHLCIHHLKVQKLNVRCYALNELLILSGFTSNFLYVNGDACDFVVEDN